MYIRIILEFFEKYKCPGIIFFPQSFRCNSNEQPCLKITGLYDLFLVCFISHSVLSFNLCFLISPSLFFDVISQCFIKCNKKYIYYIHIYLCVCLWVCLWVCLCECICLVAQSCQTLCNPIAHQAPLSMEILQARILEWVVMTSSRGSFQCWDRTQVCHIAGRSFTF